MIKPSSAAGPATPPWRVMAATALGASHARTGAPNQDAHQSAVIDTPTGPVVVLAVADGHGGRRYVRSDHGATLATALAVQVCTELLGRPGSDPASVSRALPAQLLPRWRDGVSAHLDAHPFTAMEHQRAGRDLDEAPLPAYGATLVVALIAPDGVHLVQIGDGDALVYMAGGVLRPVRDDPRLVGNQTTSLCLPDALSDFRHGFVAAAHQPSLVLVSTDGYGNSFAADDWAPAVLTDVARLVDRDGWAAVEAALPEWVAESARVGGDDVTVLIGMPPGPAAGGPGPSIAPTERLPVLSAPTLAVRPVTADAGAAAPGASTVRARRISRRALALFGGVAALVLGGSAVALSRPPGDSRNGVSGVTGTAPAAGPAQATPVPQQAPDGPGRAPDPNSASSTAPGPSGLLPVPTARASRPATTRPPTARKPPDQPPTTGPGPAPATTRATPSPTTVPQVPPGPR